MRLALAVALAGLLVMIGLGPDQERPALAQTPDAERAFVYGINAAIPNNFVGTFAPPSAGSIYLLADQTSVISPRYTEIYFWPITNEYRADWHALNEPVPGVLEITDGGRVIAELESTDYTIHFTQQDTTTTAQLFLGEDAVAAEERFRARQQAFQEAAAAYQQAERAWLEAAAEASARQQAGETVTLPPAPERPEPIGVFSNGLNRGIPINLDPGRYGIRLRGPDGKLVPGSERSLIVFAPRRSGVGYTVVPEARWTTPDESPAPSDVIVGEAGSTLYLEPHLAREYPARAWALLQNPQRSAGDAGEWEWVIGERIREGRLEVSAADGEVEQRELTSYGVKQLPGSQLGYEVIEIDPSTSRPPDFEAYPVHLEAAGEQYRIRLVSGQGDVLPGSGRLVSVPATPPITQLLVLPVVPLAVGALVIARRQRGVRMPREVVG